MEEMARERENDLYHHHMQAVGYTGIVEEVRHMKQLVSDHWNYIEKVLLHSGNKSQDEIKEIEFHYKTAMEHGWRHAKEYYTGSV